MSGMGGPDEEALHAIIMAENEEYRVRRALQEQKQRLSAILCKDCDELIPERRRVAVPGVQYCIICQPKHDRVIRQKMLYHIL